MSGFLAFFFLLAEVRYNPATEVRISGTVQDIRELAEPPDLKGIHLTLAVEKRAIQVYVAPASFLRTFDITFMKGDRLHISGSKIRFRGADLVLTREVRRDTDVLTVRDEQGNPYWSADCTAYGSTRIATPQAPRATFSSLDTVLPASSSDACG